MSSTHRKKIARALAKATGLTYQQALARVVEADNAGLLPHTLGDAGIADAVRLLVEQSGAPTTDGVAVEEPLDVTRRNPWSFPRIDLSDGLLDALKRPHGLVIVAGATGAGKSTVLYEALRDRLRDSNMVITIENPVEQYLEPQPGDRGVISQRQIGYDSATFAEEFKYALKRDPDVLLIGEIRDQEHATSALQAAVTGHLVLSAIHAFGPSATVHRLLRMGADAEDLADALNAVVTTWREKGQFFSATWTVSDEVRGLIREHTDSVTFDADLRAAFGEPPTTPADPFGYGARKSRSQRVLDVIKAGPDPSHTFISPSAGHLLITGPTGSGKSVAVRKAMRLHRDRGDRVLLIDTATGSAQYAGLAHEVATTKGETLAMLRAVLKGSARALLVIEDMSRVVEAFKGGDLLAQAIAIEPDVLRIVVTSQEAPTVRRFGNDEAGVGIDNFDTRLALGPGSHHASMTMLNARHPVAQSSLHRGWALVEYHDSEPELANVWGAPEDRPFSELLDREQVRTGLRRVAVMMRMGVAQERWFADTAQTMHGEARLVFENIAAARRVGSTCLAALSAEPHVFASWALSIVQVGEETGQLAEAFEQIAEVF